MPSCNTIKLCNLNAMWDYSILYWDTSTAILALLYYIAKQWGVGKSISTVQF